MARDLCARKMRCRMVDKKLWCDASYLAGYFVQRRRAVQGRALVLNSNLWVAHGVAGAGERLRRCRRDVRYTLCGKVGRTPLNFYCGYIRHHSFFSRDRVEREIYRERDKGRGQKRQILPPNEVYRPV